MKWVGECKKSKTITTKIMIRKFLNLLFLMLPILLLGQSPGGVSTPAVWYRADALVYSNAGTTLAGNNVSVQQWNDFMGTGRNLLQATVARRPVFSNATTLANFNPTVTFTRASTHWMQCDPGAGNEIINRASGSIYTAGYMNINFLGQTTGAGIIGFNTDMDYPGLHTSNNQLFNLLMYAENGANYTPVSTNAFAFQNGFVAGSSWQNGASTTSPATYGATTVSLNGVHTFYSGNNFANVSTTNAARFFRIGGDTDWGSHNGQLNEILVYQNVLTAQERNRLESYFAIKYGTTLSGNYVNSTNGIIWSSDASYQNNIFGIARDNNGALHQKQSRSENSNQKLIIGNASTLFNTNAANTNSLTDGQFLMVGDNGLSQSLSVAFASPSAPGGETNYRFGSIWKVQNAGTVGPVTVAWPKGMTNLHLVKSTGNATFDNSDTFLPMTAEATINGVVYNTVTVTLNNGDYFTFAGLLISPGGVTGANFWVKSDDAGNIATAWKDHSANADDIPAVGAWALSAADKAHNFHPYTTGYTSSKLFYDPTSALNGTGTSGPLAHSIFSAVRPTSAGTGRITGVDDDVTYGAEPGVSILSGSPSYYKFSNGTITNTFSSAFPVSQSSVYSTVSDNGAAGGGGSSNAGGEQRLGLNGNYQLKNDFTSGNRFQFTSNRLRIGHGDWTANGPFPGDIMEVIWYKRALTTNEQSRVNSYLALKNGTTLSENYLSSSNVIVWNRTTNSTYNNNIFGIAKDNPTGLHQKVSNSINTGTILTVAKNNDFTSSNLAASRTALPNSNSYLIFGDNNNATVAAVVAPAIGACGEDLGNGAEFRIIQRKWMVQRTNNVGTAYIQANLAAYSGGINTDMVMLVADDANFTQNVMAVPGLKNGSNYTFVHNFDNENAVRYITFGGTFVATPCEQCQGATYNLRTGYQWNQGSWANQTANAKTNILLGNDAGGTPLYASMYADYTENPSIEYIPTRFPQQYGGKWTISRRYDNTTARARHRIDFTQAMKASFQLSNINTYLNNKNNFEVIGYCNGVAVMPKITYAYNTSYHTFTIDENKTIGSMSWRGFIPNVSTANVRFDRPVDRIEIISLVDRVNTSKILSSILYGDITLECAEIVEPNPDNVYVSHGFTQETLATCGGETTMRIKVTNNNLCEDKTIDLHQILPSGLTYVPGSFNGNDLPAGTMYTATLTYNGSSFELSGLTLPRGEHWMYVDVANPGTAGTYPTQFTFEVTDGLDPSTIYSSSIKNLAYYESLEPSPAAPISTLTIKNNVTCGENAMLVNYRMKIDNPNATSITGAEIMHMFDYDQVIQSVAFVTGEDEDGIITGNYPVDGNGDPIEPIGNSIFNLVDAIIPVGVSYIDITVNVGNSYDIPEVQALGISSSFLVGFGSGECAASAESISNEVILPMCSPCTNPGATGAALGSTSGIITKPNRSVTNWPESVPNGYLVLDGAFKGMVITHMTTIQINALTPVKGMLVYDTDDQCVKLYRGAGANAPSVHPSRQGWVCIERVCID